MSPLAVSEAEAMTGAKIYSREELKAFEFAQSIVEPVMANKSEDVGAAA